MRTNKSRGKITTEAELRLADEEMIAVQPLSANQAAKASTNEGGEEDFGVELVTMIAEIDSVSDLKKVPLYQSDALTERVEHDKDDELGKSFRSKDLSEDDLSEREIMPTLEEQWILDGSNHPNVSWVKCFIIVGFLLVMTAGIWSLINLGEQEVDKEERIREAKEMALMSVQSDAEYIQNKVNVSECIKNYLEATSIEERAKYCRNPEATLRIMKKYYSSELTFDTYHFEGVIESSSMSVGGKEVTIASANVSSQSGGDGVEKKPPSLLLEKQEDGTYRIDWETAVVYQAADWSAFVTSKNTEPHVFRVEAKERIDIGPYLYEFSDDKKYQAYRIGIRGDNKKYLIGYAKKDSEVDKIMKKLVLKESNNKRKSKIRAPMMLKLVFPKDAQSDQCVEIIEVTSDSWFLP